ncbi:hypothetical protein X975_23379, partial [Stegodyphus mimosarum]
MTRETCCTSNPLAQISVAIKTLVCAERNSFMIVSLILLGISPCIDETVKSASHFFCQPINLLSCITKYYSLSNGHSLIQIKQSIQFPFFFFDMPYSCLLWYSNLGPLVQQSVSLTTLYSGQLRRFH